MVCVFIILVMISLGFLQQWESEARKETWIWIWMHSGSLGWVRSTDSTASAGKQVSVVS